jgi:soluble lytic murein transglycosylase-like protein
MMLPKWLQRCAPLLIVLRALAQSGQTPPLPTPGSPDSSAALREAIARQRAAMELQREAARKQTETMHLEPLRTTLTPLVQPVEFDCDPVPEATINPMIEGAAKANHLETNLLRAVIRQESQFYPCAVSDKGAEGLMQLMPATGEQFGAHDAFDPKQSIEAGAKYLKQLFDRYQGKLDWALGAYNAGPAAVDDAKGIPDIPETQNYVQAILDSLRKTTGTGANTGAGGGEPRSGGAAIRPPTDP